MRVMKRYWLLVFHPPALPDVCLVGKGSVSDAIPYRFVRHSSELVLVGNSGLRINIVYRDQ
jgi:hypothetical protein